MSTFDFKSWCEANQLKEATIEVLKKEDLDSEEALKLFTSIEAALRKLKQTGAKKTTSDENTPVTTKTLAKDGGLEEILKKIEGAGTLEDSLLALGTTDFSGSGKSPAMLNSTTLDNDTHMFLGRQQKAGTKQGEKPLLIPDFVNLGTYDISEEEQEIGNKTDGGATLSICIQDF